MKTYMPGAAGIERKWYVVDAEGKTLGRLATVVAATLRGKNKPKGIASEFAQVPLRKNRRPQRALRSSWEYPVRRYPNRKASRGASALPKNYKRLLLTSWRREFRRRSMRKRFFPLHPYSF